jgi:hypothetical protein
MEPTRARHDEIEFDWSEDLIFDETVQTDEAPTAKLRSALGIKRRSGGSPLSLMKRHLEDAYPGARAQCCLSTLLVPSAFAEISDLNELLMSLAESSSVEEVETPDYGPELIFPHRMILGDLSYERAAIWDMRFRIVFRPEAGLADRMIIEAKWDEADVISCELSGLLFDEDDIFPRYPETLSHALKSA